jgi:hypothetical protein
MRRIGHEQEPATLAACSIPRRILATSVVGTLVLAAHGAHATLTNGVCLAQKRVAWGDLRKCQAGAEGKALKGKLGDLAKCQTKFQEKLAKITAKATKATIACRYGRNGDGTVTDYDTGLQWEQKDGVDGVPVLSNPHDVDNTYVWSASSTAADGPLFDDFLDKLNRCTSADAVTLGGGFAGHCDWRLPTVVELQAILEDPFPCGTSPCIDPTLGPTVANNYWSGTTLAAHPDGAWVVDFADGRVIDAYGKANSFLVRAVRPGL